MFSETSINNLNINNKYINKQLSVDNININTVVNCTVVEANVLFEDLKPLVNQQFKPWYCKQFYRLGRLKVLELASLARADARDPARYFSRLLKVTV